MLKAKGHISQLPQQSLCHVRKPPWRYTFAQKQVSKYGHLTSPHHSLLPRNHIRASPGTAAADSLQDHRVLATGLCNFWAEKLFWSGGKDVLGAEAATQCPAHRTRVLTAVWLWYRMFFSLIYSNNFSMFGFWRAEQAWSDYNLSSESLRDLSKVTYLAVMEPEGTASIKVHAKHNRYRDQ